MSTIRERLTISEDRFEEIHRLLKADGRRQADLGLARLQLYQT
jgi:hypothetical protein